MAVYSLKITLLRLYALIKPIKSLGTMVVRNDSEKLQIKLLFYLLLSLLGSKDPASTYLLKVNNRNTRLSVKYVQS